MAPQQDRAGISAEGLATAATYAVGLLGILAGRFVFGFGWVASVLLAMPFHSLACGIVNNESRRMTGALCALLLFPIVVACGTELVSKVMASLSRQGLQDATTVAVAAEVGGATAPAAAGSTLDARISEGQKRVKDILDGK